MNIKFGCLLFILVAISSCSLTPSSACNKQVALQKGTRLIQEKFPRSFKDTQPIVISKGKGFWRINGSLPPLVAGGVPKVKLNFKTCEVLELYHTQ